MSGEDALSRMEALLKDHEERIKLLEQKLGERHEAKKADEPAPAPAAASKTPSVRQFIIDKGPVDDVQKSLVIAYHLEKHAEYKSFNVKDIEKGFVDAREKVPGNVADKILKNVWKGHIMQVPEEKDSLKAYALTNTGTKFVESGFK
jgi:hypothetical protein